MWALEKDFWTSGTSTGCAGAFEWCSKNAPFARRENLWRDGHPVGEEACVTIALFDKISGQNSSLASSPCQETKLFICEASKLYFCKKLYILQLMFLKFNRRQNLKQRVCRKIWNALKIGA
jgi:hypothetical protein